MAHIQQNAKVGENCYSAVAVQETQHTIRLKSSYRKVGYTISERYFWQSLNFGNIGGEGEGH